MSAITFEMTSRTRYADGRVFAQTGPYERIDGLL